MSEPGLPRMPFGRWPLPPRLDEQPLGPENAKAALRKLVRAGAFFMQNRDLGTTPVVWAWELARGGNDYSATGRACNDRGRLCCLLRFRNDTVAAVAARIAPVAAGAPVLVQTTGIGLSLVQALRDAGCDAEPLDEAHQTDAGAATICGVISYAGRKGEPLACAFPEGHAGTHAWATLPTWGGAPAAPQQERPQQQEATGIVL